MWPLRGPVALAWLASIAVHAGCFAPAAPAGAPCAPGRVCPDGLTCTTTSDGDVCLFPGGGTPPGDDASTGPGACTEKTLLAGGEDVEKQGWQILRSGQATITYGPGFTELRTDASPDGSRQLIVLPNAVGTDRYILEFTMQVVLAGGHSEANASAAILGSFHDPTGSSDDLARMIYLDIDAIGFGAGGTKIGFDTTMMRVYHLERTADAKFVVQIPGSFKLSTGPYDTNGTIAVGDQTNVAGLDSTIRISQIRRLCP